MDETTDHVSLLAHARRGQPASPRRSVSEYTRFVRARTLLRDSLEEDRVFLVVLQSIKGGRVIHSQITSALRANLMETREWAE